MARAQARTGTVEERAVAGVPSDLLERYFERPDRRFTSREELRRIVVVGRNDLFQDTMGRGTPARRYRAS